MVFKIDSLARAFRGIVNCLKRVAIYNPPKKMVSFLMPILNAPPFAPYPTSSLNSMAKVVPLPTWLSYT